MELIDHIGDWKRGSKGHGQHDIYVDAAKKRKSLRNVQRSILGKGGVMQT